MDGSRGTPGPSGVSSSYPGLPPFRPARPKTGASQAQLVDLAQHPGNHEIQQLSGIAGDGETRTRTGDTTIFSRAVQTTQVAKSLENNRFGLAGTVEGRPDPFGSGRRCRSRADARRSSNPVASSARIQTLAFVPRAVASGPGVDEVALRRISLTVPVSTATSCPSSRCSTGPSGSRPARGSRGGAARGPRRYRSRAATVTFAASAGSSIPSSARILMRARLNR